MVSYVKLPILKKVEYILWTMKTEQYLAHTDYALWEVFLNGNSAVHMTKDEAGNEIKVLPVTVQQILARTREKKAKSTLLMAILDEHLARFHRIKDAKTLWAAIKTRFGGIDNLDIDDLYNNLKVYEADIKGSSGSSSNSHNVAFVFAESTSSTNELILLIVFLLLQAIFLRNKLDKEDLEQIGQDDLEEIDLKWQVAMLSMRVKRFYKKARRKLEFNGKEPVGFDKNKVECFNCHRRGHFARDCRSTRNSGNRSKDAGNTGYRGRDNGKRHAKEEDEQALETDSDDDSVFTPEPIPAKIDFVKAVSAAKPKAAASTSAAKPVNTVGPKQSVNFSRTRSTFHKSHSPIRRSFYNATTHSRRNSTKRVNTARSKAVSVVKRNRVTDVKTSVGHPQQALKNKGIVDSGCSRHMTSNKAYLADYQEIHDGGFINFGSSRASIDESNLRHMRLGHVNFKTMNKLVKGNIVRGPPLKIFNNDHSCVACQKGKQHKATCLAGCFSWLLRMKLVRDLDEFYGMKRIKREYSDARTPQQNRVAERKNKNLIEATRTMLADSLLPITFWAEAVNTACYVLNRALVTKTHNKNPYELLNSRSPRLDFMRPFGCPATILNTLDPLGKFEGKADEGFLVGYSVTRNQTDKNAGPQDTNGNVGTQDNVNAGHEVSDQHYIMLPLWSSISSTYKSSNDKPADDKPKDDTGSKTVEEPVNKEDQAYRDELDRLMSQKKEASDVADALRKEFEQGCMDQKEVTQDGSTNSFNTVSNPVNATSTSGTFKKTAELQSTGIFNNAYDNDLDIYTSSVQSVGAEADFNNMESSFIVSPIPTHKVHIDHPKDQILGDLSSAVQTRGVVKKSSGAYALIKRRDQGLPQIESDAELAQRIYEEELAELDRAQKERQKQEEATIAALTEEFDEIQARMDGDHELAIRMTHEEQEMYIIKERARLLAEYFERRKKQLAAERAKEIRNKPPTRNQARNRMITYLKHMGKYTHQQLKHKTFEELQMLYEREKKWIDDFVPIDKEEIMDPEILSTKYHIVDWESQILGNVDIKDKHVYKIIRANGNTSYYKSLSSMLRKFDRQDFVDLHRLVMKRFEDNTLEEKRYPLIKEMLEKMLNWKLEAKAESIMAFELLKFIKSQIEERRDVWIHPSGDQDADNEET
uniref:Uncharacterized protein n=1 Tax=Tanacetum cinerariifolium TaxID=118510 RepID=A0A6L2NAC3_TANCI|nr:hypothetical protein [Tanacetum cinerariifolium]